MKRNVTMNNKFSLKPFTSDGLRNMINTILKPKAAEAIHPLRFILNVDSSYENLKTCNSHSFKSDSFSDCRIWEM